jgi:putative protease
MKKKTVAAMKRRVLAAKRPPARRVTVKKVTMKKPIVKKAVMKKPVTPKIVGRVVHFYDRICVAIVELATPIRLGEIVEVKHRDVTFAQVIASMQIEHQPVAVAKKGDVIGMKVDRPVPEGALLFRV